MGLCSYGYQDRIRIRGGVLVTKEEMDFINMNRKEYRKLYTEGQCSTCKYRRFITDGTWMCLYYYDEGQRRQSLPPNCNKYVKRRKKRRRNKFNPSFHKNV